MSRQPPVSFKTVPSRNKTQKWQTARQYNYDGDEWGGGYDEYDDYSDQSAPPPAAAPQPPYSSRLQKQGSFDRGDERRQFSGPANLNMYSSGMRGPSPARSAMSNSSGSRPSVDAPIPRPTMRPRDFTNPDEVPRPLNTRISPAPSGPPSAGAQPSSRPFTPQQADVNTSVPAEPNVVPPPSADPSSAGKEKALPTIPFVRPSDIYKRMEAEKARERASMESSSRPSMDSIQREAPPSTSEHIHQRQLSSVQESPTAAKTLLKSTGFDEEPIVKTQKASPVLPELSRFSGFGFGSDFINTSVLSSTSQPNTGTSSALASSVAPPNAESAMKNSFSTGNDAAASGRTKADQLAHQPSSGYRSMVNQAFDNKTVPSVPQTPLSRDGSASVSEVSRSNTTSTGNISPIMSRVLPATVPQRDGMDREAGIGSIAEESPLRTGPPAMDFSNTAQSRKPMTSGIGNASSGEQAASLAAAGVQAGYRRSLDPPHADNSPAHSLEVETAQTRRLSGPFSAQTVGGLQGSTEGAALSNQAPAELPDSSVLAHDASDALPTTGRPRAGTDYSIREADMASQVNSPSNDPTYDSDVAARGTENQNMFLTSHVYNPSSPATPIGRSASPLDGATNSPSKGRVKQMADKFHEIHKASRSNSITSSKSSWSNFRGSDENLALKRKGTDTSLLGTGEQDDVERPRPLTPSGVGMKSQTPGPDASLRPRMPGEWVSFSSASPSGIVDAATSARRDRDITPRASQMPQQASEIDLTPTTNKVQLRGTRGPGTVNPSDGSDNLFSQAKNTGEALGAALLATVGLGHQTRDFGSSDPAPEVVQPLGKSRAGDYDTNLRPPPLRRGDTEATNVTDIASPASTMAPTPPVKDARRSDDYFPDPVGPLRAGQSGAGSASRPGVIVPHYQSDDLTDDDNDRLREEIEQSLTPAEKEVVVEEDLERLQDGLDAPGNALRVAAGKNALPAAEMQSQSLNRKFSWEKPREQLPAPSAAIASRGVSPAPPPVVKEPEPEPSPEIKPEMPYERPRSRGLHIMNADSSDEEEEREKPAPPQPTQSADLSSIEGMPFSAFQGFSSLGGSPSEGTPGSKGHDYLQLHLSPSLTRKYSEGKDLKELAPTPVSADFNNRLPSYYLRDHSPVGAGGSDPAISREISREEPAEADFNPAIAPTSVLKINSPSSAQDKKIPPFREILAIKTAPERIDAYNETRQTFADTQTGLRNWLSGMLEQHPEYANLSTQTSGFKAPALQTSTSGFGNLGHRKNSPSIALKFGKGPDSSHRTGSIGDGTDPANRTPTKEYGSNPLDVDKMQQRGKDLMKSASVLGGKAQVGAKGLWQKGRNRLATATAKRESGGSAGGAAGSGKGTARHSHLRAVSSPVSVPPLIESEAETPVGSQVESQPGPRDAEIRSDRPISAPLLAPVQPVLEPSTARPETVAAEASVQPLDATPAEQLTAITPAEQPNAITPIEEPEIVTLAEPPKAITPAEQPEAITPISAAQKPPGPIMTAPPPIPAPTQSRPSVSSPVQESPIESPRSRSRSRHSRAMSSGTRIMAMFRPRSRSRPASYVDPSSSYSPTAADLDTLPTLEHAKTASDRPPSLPLILPFLSLGLDFNSEGKKEEDVDNEEAIATTSPLSPLNLPSNRIETWNEPSKILPPPRTPFQSDNSGPETPWRIGVLPSPSTTEKTGCFEAGASPRVVSSGSGALASPRFRSASAGRESSPVKLVGERAERPPVPIHRRENSDLNGLPSQMRRLSLWGPAGFDGTGAVVFDAPSLPQPLGGGEDGLMKDETQTRILEVEDAPVHPALRQALQEEYQQNEEDNESYDRAHPSLQQTFQEVHESKEENEGENLVEEASEQVKSLESYRNNQKVLIPANGPRPTPGSSGNNIDRSPLVSPERTASPAWPSMQSDPPSPMVEFFEARSEISDNEPEQIGQSVEPTKPMSIRSPVSSLGALRDESLVARDVEITPRDRLSPAIEEDSTDIEPEDHTATPLAVEPVPEVVEKPVLGLQTRMNESAYVGPKPISAPAVVAAPSKALPNTVEGEPRQLDVEDDQPLDPPARSQTDPLEGQAVREAPPGDGLDTNPLIVPSTRPRAFSFEDGATVYDFESNRNPKKSAVLQSAKSTMGAKTGNGVTSPTDRKGKRWSDMFRTSKPSAVIAKDHKPGQIPSLAQKTTSKAQPEVEEMRGRRRSGVWEAVKRGTSGSRSKSRRRSGLYRLEDPPIAMPKRPATLPLEERVLGVKVVGASSGAPQTSQTVRAATGPELKKKQRFPSLGTFFGRSAAEERTSEKPNKLTKAPPQRRPASQVRGDEPPDIARTRGRSLPPGAQSPNNGEVTYKDHVTNLKDVALPVGGIVHELQLEVPPAAREPTLPRFTPPLPETFNTHYHGQSRGDRDQGQNHGDSRPVHPAYTHQRASLDQHRRQDGSWGVRDWQPTYPNQPTAVSDGQNPNGDQRRHSSYASTGYPLSPQISGRSEWQRSDWRQRGSTPVVSPMAARKESGGWRGPSGARVGSIDKEMARNRSRQYSESSAPRDPEAYRPDREAPVHWKSSFPPNNGHAQPGPPNQNQDVHVYRPYMDQEQDDESPPPDWPVRTYHETPPPSTTSPPGRRRQKLPWESTEWRPDGQRTPPYSPETFTHPSQHPYPPQPLYHAIADPPYDPSSPGSSTVPRSYRRRQSSDADPRGPPMQGGPHNGRRQSSQYEQGYSMKGVSYPGQEWNPWEMNGARWE